MLNPPLLEQACARNHISGVVATCMILRVHPPCTWHRAGVVCDLTPTQAKPKQDHSRGWRLKADELDHEFLRCRLAFLEACSDRSLGAPKAAPKRENHPSCRMIHPVGVPGRRERLGWDVRALRGVSCRPLALNLFSKPARAACVAVCGAPMACVDPVKKEARQVHRTCVGLSCRTTFCDGSMEPKCEEWRSPVVLPSAWSFLGRRRRSSHWRSRGRHMRPAQVPAVQS